MLIHKSLVIPYHGNIWKDVKFDISSRNDKLDLNLYHLYFVLSDVKWEYNWLLSWAKWP